MIPKITQDAPNIVPRYWCSTCGRSLPAPDQHDDQWRFCPRCGEPIEYEKAEPVQWREQNCEKCGRPLIQRCLLYTSLPQGHGSFLPIFGFFSPTGFAGAASASSFRRLSRSSSLGKSASMIPRRSSSAFILPSASAFLIFGPNDSVWGICSSDGKRSKSSLGV